MEVNNIMDINRILDEARDLGCSDLHFTAGLPPVVRLHGSIRKLGGYPDCTEPIIVNIINQITSIKHKSQISKGLDTDFSYVSTSGYRHRVNVYRQRGYHAVAIRLLRNDIPTLADLSLPATLNLMTWGEGLGGTLAIAAAAKQPAHVVKCAAQNPLCTGAYADCAQYAAQLACPLLMGTSGMDTVAPPSAQDAVFDAATCAKKRYVYAKYIHERINAFEDRVLAFFHPESTL